jgi:hypothetical protein
MSLFDLFDFGGESASYDTGPSFLDGASGAASDAASGFFGDISFGDIGETLGMTFGNMLTGMNDGMPEWLSSSNAFQSLLTSGPGTLEKANVAKDGGGLLDKIGGFVEKNKTLSELALKGFGGAVAAKNAKNAATANSRSRIEELRVADQLKQGENARMSASVSGLRAPGLIGKQMQLKRTDGTPVYTNGRIA